MNILNLDSRVILNEYYNDFYKNNETFLIVCKPSELKLLKDTLYIDEVTYNDCLKFDEAIRLDLFDNYDFLSINTFELIGEKAQIDEVNIYLSDNFILVVCSEKHFVYKYVLDIITNNTKIENTPSVVSLFQINYMILKKIVMHEFENIEKVEDLILQIEDEILEGVVDNQMQKINNIRSITRILVKNTRPLLYIGERILKEDIRYLKYSDVKKYNLDNLQGIDFGIERLYGFALSTRELADKLLDIYTSQVAEKTNSIITRLTILTGIAAPLTIITGIYGMNFENMPELKWYYGYPIILVMMLLIILIGIIIFKIKKIL